MMDYAKALEDLNKWMAYGDVASHELAAEHGEAIRSALELAMKVDKYYKRACQDAALCLGMNTTEPPESLSQAIGMIRGPEILPVKQSIYATFARQFERLIQAATKGTRG